MKSGMLAVVMVASGCAGIEPQRGHDEVAKYVKQRTGSDTGWVRARPMPRSSLSVSTSCCATG